MCASPECNKYMTLDPGFPSTARQLDHITWRPGQISAIMASFMEEKDKIFLKTLETWASTLEISKYNWIYIVVGMLFLTNQTFNQIWTIKINSSSNPHSHFDWTRGWLKLLLRIRRLSSSMKEKYKLRGQIWAVTKVSLIAVGCIWSIRAALVNTNSLSLHSLQSLHPGIPTLLHKFNLSLLCSMDLTFNGSLQCV